MPFAQRLAQHSSRDFGVPVIERTEYGNQNPSDDHVMKVRHDEVGVTELPIEGCSRLHDAGETGDQELKQKRDTEQHRRLELNLSAPHRAQPIEDFDSSRNPHAHCGNRKKTVGIRIHSDGKHMVRPHTQTYETDADRSGNHDGVAKNRFARKHRDDFRQERKARDHQDVDLGMAKYPEEMHPKYGGSTRLCVEEMPTHITVDKKHDLSG